MGDRGGLGGGDWGLVSESAGCTAADSVGAGRDVGGPAGVPEGVLRKKRKSLLATSRRRDKDSLSRARRSSWSFCKRATRRDLTLRGGRERCGRRGRDVQGVDMREGDVGQAGGRRRAFARSTRGGRGGRHGGGGLERVVVVVSCARYLPRGGEEDGAGGFDVTRRRGFRDPLVAESATNMLRIEPGDGGIKLDSSRQERREELLRRVSVLGPRGGPRGCTTTTRGHSEC